jgi:hypothetical protein
MSATLLVRLSLLRTRAFDPDELQHLHAAWSFQQGLLPFRDFFEHHMPGIYYLLAPLMRVYDTAHDVGAVLSVIFLARTMMWVFTAAAIAFTVLLGRRFRSPVVGWLSGAILSLSVVFVARTLEIRPDVPALALWTACTWTMITGLSRANRTFIRAWWTVSGLLFGVTLLFTQKALLAGPGFALFAIVYMFASEKDRPVFAKFLDLAVFGVASIVPLLALVAHYWSQGALGFLVDGVLTKNIGWIQETTASATFRWMLLRDPLACALVVGGCVVALFELVRQPNERAVHAAVLLPAASLFAGMAVIPAPYPQYLLLVMPLAAVYAANGLWIAVSRDSRASRIDQIEMLTSVVAFIAIALLGLSIARPFFRSSIVYPLLGVVLVAVTIGLVRFGRPELASLAIVVGIATLTAQQLLWMAGLSNREALDEMRFIHQASSSTETVMDGFSGFGWFRPQASYYWFTAPGVRAKLSTAQKAALVTTLERCGDAPKVVILDEHLHALSAEVDPVVSANYQPTRYPLIWLRAPAHQSCKPASAAREVTTTAAQSLPIR